VADHIVPVWDEMPDDLFFAAANLRASCHRHNTQRGIAARYNRETVDTAVVTADYSKAGS
jgi:hypothetical protein